jgi:hypothetical protein
MDPRVAPVAALGLAEDDEEKGCAKNLSTLSRPQILEPGPTGSVATKLHAIKSS